MSDLSELLQAIDASLRSVDYTLTVARLVHPPSHRGDMARSQLEAAREILVKAKDYASGKSSGMYPALRLTDPPPEPPVKKS